MIFSNSPTTKKSTMRLHPNPATDIFQISGLNDTVMVTINDLNCISMLRQQITADEPFYIDTLKKGVYIAKIITSTETVERNY